MYLHATQCEDHLEELGETDTVDAAMKLLPRWLPQQSPDVPDPWSNCYVQTGKAAWNFRTNMRTRLKKVMQRSPDGKTWLETELVRDPNFANNPEEVLKRRRRAAIERCVPHIRALRELLRGVRADDAMRVLLTVLHLDYDQTTRSWEKAKKNIRDLYNM